jgi:hypothetical protein
MRAAKAPNKASPFRALAAACAPALPIHESHLCCFFVENDHFKKIMTEFQIPLRSGAMSLHGPRSAAGWH